MSTDDPTIIAKRGNLLIWFLFNYSDHIYSGWLKLKLHSQTKWHRRYCIIDWDKAILFIALKADTHYRSWIKLLPNIFINDCEASHENTIEIKVDSKE
jgi:hypothetical protein